MPKSKRNKVVALTKVKKKGREGKEALVENVQSALEEYPNAYVVSFEQMRAGPFKELAQTMKSDSKFFLGKNKVVQVALGKGTEDEVADNSHLLSKYMRGQVCLLFSQKSKKDVEQALNDFQIDDFATAGSKASYTVHLEKGTDALSGFSHSMEGYFKQMGLPVKLNFGKIELLSEVYVCREGQVLNVEQAKLLKTLGHKMANFNLKVLVQRNSKGQVKETDAGAHFLKTMEGEE